MKYREKNPEFKIFDLKETVVYKSSQMSLHLTRRAFPIHNITL